MPYYGGTSDVASEDDPLCTKRSEPASEFKILIQSTQSEEAYEEEDLLSPTNAGRSSRRFLVLLACTIVGFVMNVLVSVVAPFFPAEAKRLTGTNNTVIGFIFAIFPLTSLVVAPLINLCIRRLGRKWTLCVGLLTLSLSTLGFGLSTSIPLWALTRVLQGAGSAAAGATYYAILSDMYTDNLGFVIGIQEAVTGLGYMVGPMLGAGLYSLGGFRLPFLILGFFPLAVCLMLPPLLRDAHNFDPSHNIPCTSSPSVFGEDEASTSTATSTSTSTSNLDADGKPASSLSLQDPPPLSPSLRGGKKSSVYLSFPFVYVSLGTTLATCGFAFLEPVLSEHLMTTLHVSTSTSGLLMGLPSITYIVAAPLGGWLGEVCGYRPILFLGFLIFAVGLALVGPMPLIPPDVDLDVQWALQVLALGMLGVGSAFGTITTMPDLKHIAGPGTTDDVACIFNNVLVPAGEVMGPLIGGMLTQLLGFRWAAFSFGCLLLLYGLLLLLMHLSGHLTWAHHREEEDEAASYLLDRRVVRVGSQEGIECSYASLDTVGDRYQHLLPQDGFGDDQSDSGSWEPGERGEEQEERGTQIPRRPGSPAYDAEGHVVKPHGVWLSKLITSVLGERGLMEEGEGERAGRQSLEGPRQ